MMKNNNKMYIKAQNYSILSLFSVTEFCHIFLRDALVIPYFTTCDCRLVYGGKYLLCNKDLKGKQFNKFKNVY